MGLTFGSDPEFMLKNKDGDLVSAVKVLRGFGKSNKIDLPYNQKTFYDNVLMEFNVAPSATFHEFVENFTTCLRAGGEIVATQGLILHQQSSAIYPESECMDEESQRFGCDPEYTIYNAHNGIIRQLDPPTLEKGNTFRSCGGHIHIGHPIATMDEGNPPLVVKMMDIFVGSTALLINHDRTADARRQIYGGAGTHRIADYGLEYRTLSNFWLRTPAFAEVIYRLTRLAVQLSVARPSLADLASNKETESIINSGDIKSAKMLYEKTRKMMSDDLQDKINNLAFLAKNGESFYGTTMEEAWQIQRPAKTRIA